MRHITFLSRLYCEHGIIGMRFQLPIIIIAVPTEYMYRYGDAAKNCAASVGSLIIIVEINSRMQAIRTLDL